jgi:uncharacterized membrane protein
MTAEFLRDAAATAAVFGFFAASWFGWAQEAPPRSWRRALVAGSAVSLLTARRRTALIPVRIALVVGLHLVPLAALLRYPLLYVVAALVTLVALAAVPLARSRSVAISAVAGLATGTVLLAAALFSIGSALHWP